MLSTTSLLLSNRHQIEFFHFDGKKNAHSINNFTEGDMEVLTTSSANQHAKWINSNVFNWFVYGTRTASASKTWAVFSPYSFTKFMQGTIAEFTTGFVQDYYKSQSCRYWMIPINWSGNSIPR
jgi:hypothetical protein